MNVKCNALMCSLMLQSSIAFGMCWGTPDIFDAVSMGDEVQVRAWLDSGVDVEARNKGGETALHVAAANNKSAIAVLLLQYGADADSKDTVFEETPLMHAARKGNIDILCLLKQVGADVNAKTRTVLGHDGLCRGAMTALHLAAKNGQVKSVAWLLKHGAKIDTPEELGRTPLHVALLENNAEAAFLLIESGSNVDAQTKFGWTPLRYAVDHCEGKISLGVVKKLLEFGADITLADNDRITPIEAASPGARGYFDLLFKGSKEKVTENIKILARARVRKTFKGQTPIPIEDLPVVLATYHSLVDQFTKFVQQHFK